jgi:hypothetical protein
MNNNTILEELVTRYADIIVSLVALCGREKTISALKRTIKEIEHGSTTQDYN